VRRPEQTFKHGAAGSPRSPCPIQLLRCRSHKNRRHGKGICRTISRNSPGAGAERAGTIIGGKWRGGRPATFDRKMITSMAPPLFHFAHCPNFEGCVHNASGVDLSPTALSPLHLGFGLRRSAAISRISCVMLRPFRKAAHLRLKCRPAVFCHNGLKVKK